MRITIPWPLNRTPLFLPPLISHLSQSHLTLSQPEEILVSQFWLFHWASLYQTGLLLQLKSLNFKREEKEEGQADMFMYNVYVYLVSIAYIVSFCVVTPGVLTSS